MAQRYDNDYGSMVEDDTGFWVTHDDYAALEAKYLELAGWALDAPCDRATEELAKEALGKWANTSGGSSKMR